MKEQEICTGMDNKEFGKGLEKRTRQFAVSIIRLSAMLSVTPEGRVVRML